MKDPVIIRQAVMDDIPAMLSIYNDIILTTTAVWQNEPQTLLMRQQWLLQKQQQQLPVFVSIENNILTGFCTFGPFRQWEGYRYTVENSVYVDKNFRGKGIANLLMKPLITAARDLQLHTIVAGIESENIASIALHKKFGFVKAAHFKQVGFKFNRWLDLTFMQLIL